MERFSIREVIEMAVQTEKLGYQFYTKMAEKFPRDAGLKDLFERLAAMEASHERIFTGLMGKVTDAEPEGWDEAQHYFRAIVESEFFIGAQKSLPSMDHIKSADDAFDQAMGFEKESVLFYMGIKRAVADKAAVDGIIAEETSHITWLSEFRKKASI